VETDIRPLPGDRDGRHDDPGPIGQHREQRRAGGGEMQPHGQRIDHLDAADRGELALAHTARKALVAQDVHPDGLGIEFGAILKHHPGA
jgi:hypothetical protein